MEDRGEVKFGCGGGSIQQKITSIVMEEEQFINNTRYNYWLPLISFKAMLWSVWAMILLGPKHGSIKEDQALDIIVKKE